MPVAAVVRRVGTVALSAALALTAGPAGAAGARPEPKAPRAFVALRDIDPTIIQDMRYATAHDFVGRPINGYRQPVCILTRPAALALHRAQLELRRAGYSLKVYDCYRPQRAVDEFVAWAGRPGDQAMKKEFYPRVGKRRLIPDGYIAARSAHSRGSTMDVTIVRLPARPAPAYRPGQPLVSCYAAKSERFPDDSIDMGTGFDCFDTLAHTLDPRVQGAQRRDRMLLKRTLEGVGMVNLPEEWWHFTYRREPFPDTYFDFPVTCASLTGH